MERLIRNYRIVLGGWYEGSYSDNFIEEHVLITYVSIFSFSLRLSMIKNDASSHVYVRNT